MDSTLVSKGHHGQGGAVIKEALNPQKSRLLLWANVDVTSIMGSPNEAEPRGTTCRVAHEELELRYHNQDAVQFTECNHSVAG